MGDDIAAAPAPARPGQIDLREAADPIGDGARSENARPVNAPGTAHADEPARPPAAPATASSSLPVPDWSFTPYTLTALDPSVAGEVAVVRMAYAGVATVLLIVAGGVLAIPDELHVPEDWSGLAGFALAVLAVAVVAAGFVHGLRRRLRAERPAGRRAHPDGGGDAELGRRSLAIELQVRTYQNLTRRQAGTAFVSSLVAMFVALAVLAAGTQRLLGTEGAGNQVFVGGFTALGSMFSAFLGATFLDAHRRAAEQLTRSHAIPLAQQVAYFAYQLTAVVQRPQARDDLVEDIVASTLVGVELTMSGFAGPAEPRRRLRRRRSERGRSEGGRGEGGRSEGGRGGGGRGDG